MIWMQSLEGRAIDLLDPTVPDVEFWEIARTLAQLNRYAGASAVPVSVALHTLIACDAAPEPLKPWVLLHDCHEARIGEIPTPAWLALCAIVRRESGSLLATLVAEAMETLKATHDRVIHQAAGLPLPDAAQRAAIRHADLVALATERRDFLAIPPRPWVAEVEAVTTLERINPYTLTTYSRAQAHELMDRFRTYLPALAETKSPLLKDIA